MSHWFQSDKKITVNILYIEAAHYCRKCRLKLFMFEVKFCKGKFDPENITVGWVQLHTRVGSKY